METFKFTSDVSLADANRQSISEGSVLINIDDKNRGVVVWVGRAGSIPDGYGGGYGDIKIQRSPGIIRVTNKYSKWRHIPKADQTYEERLLSWSLTSYEHFSESISEDEGRAISGILALLPDDAVNWDSDRAPYSLDDALSILADYLSQRSIPV